MKKVVFFLMIVSFNVVFSQVGIGTRNPQGTFNVDGAKDNPASTTPSSIQQSNDFVVLPNGNTGIGITNPVKSYISVHPLLLAP